MNIHKISQNFRTMRITICVESTHQNYKLDVNPSDTIKDIKLKIKNQGIVSYPPEQMALRHFSDTIKDNYTIKYYSIGEKSKIYVLHCLKLSIYTKSLTCNHYKLEVHTTDFIIDVKQQLYDLDDSCRKFGIRLMFCSKYLEDYKTIQDYSIIDGSTVHIILRARGGGICAKEPSPVIGPLENDTGKVTKPLESGQISLRYIRTTNASLVYEQRGGTCYAFAACSAYINTILRIYGSRPPPSFQECFDVACYNGENGGKAIESLKRLESKFQYGILCKKCDRLLIRDAMTISVIVSFSTSDEGWDCVANGSLLEFPGGISHGWHASIVDGYDLEKDCAILKNSWGGESASPRFDFTASAAHDVQITRVYFTVESIKGKTNKVFIPRLIKCKEILEDHEIECAWMDEETAQYETNYVCEFHPEKNDEYKYHGYNVYQWIDINLNRPKGATRPIYHDINENIKKEMLKELKSGYDDEAKCDIA